MRLSHWDFRPKQRRKYVIAGAADGRFGSRKRPALRILLLAAAGAVVYLKYDSFVQSPWLDKLKHPERLGREAWTWVREKLPAAAPLAVPAFSADSTWMEWTCGSARQDSCLGAWSALGEDQKGALRAALLKARLHGGFPEPDSFAAVFHREPAQADPDPAGAWELARVKLLAGARSLTWAALPDASGSLRWCALPPEGAACPAEPGPQPPLRLFTSADPGSERPPRLAFRTAGGEPIHPVLPGKVLDLPQGSEGWLKLHHGGTLFSYYSGFSRLRPGLAAGSRVEDGDTLAFMGEDAAGPSAGTDSLPADPSLIAAVAGLLPPPENALLLRIEKDGSPLDPQAFLGLEVDSIGGSHAR